MPYKTIEFKEVIVEEFERHINKFSRKQG